MVKNNVADNQCFGEMIELGLMVAVLDVKSMRDMHQVLDKEPFLRGLDYH